MTETSTALAKPVVHEIPRTAEKSIFDKLVAGESVHLDDFEQLLNRFSAAMDEDIDVLLNKVPANHSFGIYPPGYKPDEDKTTPPAAVVYVKLMRLGDSKGGAIPNKDLPGDILSILKKKDHGLVAPDTAIFYSVSSLSKPLPGLPEGMSNAEYLIKQTAEKLQHQYGIRKFSTLSPLRQKDIKTGEIVGFGSWLEAAMESKDASKHFTRKEEESIIECGRSKLMAERLPLGTKFLSLVRNQAELSQPQRQRLHQMLRALTLEYLMEPNDKKSFTDRVEKFHLGNGALLGNIHVRSREETTAAEWQHAYGVMVNYVYDLDKELLAARQQAFEQGSRMPYPHTRAEHLRHGNRVLADTDLLLEYKHRKSQLAVDNSWRGMRQQTKTDADAILSNTGAKRARAARAL